MARSKQPASAIVSAGIALWRRREGRVEVLLGHPGGPYFEKKDADTWTIPKGEVEPGEQLLAVARREFEEETGHQVPDGPMIELGEIRQKGGKVVVAWGTEGDLDPAEATSNTFEVEWPPRSGRMQAFPELDRVEWFDLPTAHEKIKAAQGPLLDRLSAAIGGASDW
jgi:predicted NUDIX family NTP pyrophosphohydrolase